ncbi:hypothetical protein Gpo141_00005544 [Globisporangium polare]
MSISVSRESISKLMTELVDTFPMESEGRSSISDFGKLLFTEGQTTSSSSSSNNNNNNNGSSASSSNNNNRSGLTPPSEEDENEDDDDDNDEDENDEDEDDEEDEEQSAIEDAKIAGMPAVTGGITAPGQKRVFTEIKGVPRQKQPDIMKSKDKAVPKRWTQEEDERLREAVGRHGERNWKSIAEEVPGRNHTQCLQRWTKVLAPGLVKGHWRPDEDELLKELVAEGRKNWGQVATRIPGRTSKQCRERWYNHLDPSIVRGEYSAEEDRIILEAQARLGNRWSAIAAMLPGRTEDAVKIRWKSLCRVRKGQGRRAQSGEKGKGSTPKNGNGVMMVNGMPQHPHMMHHHHPHQQLHHHQQHMQQQQMGSFSGPMVKSEELGGFSSNMRAQQAAHMNRMQYANAMSTQQQQQQQQQQQAVSMGYHVMNPGMAPGNSHSMLYASDMGTLYDPTTGQQYRKPQAQQHMHSAYGLPPTIPAPGQEFNIDRRANVVNLSTPTQQPQVYRSTSGGGYATTTSSPYGAAGGLATDMNGNIYTTSAMGGATSNSAGSYAQMGSMTPMYHQPQQQQMMSSSYNGGGYSVQQAPATPANVAGTFAQHFMQQSQPQQQMYQQQHNVQESETQQQQQGEAPSPQQQQQKESAMSSSDGQNGHSTTKSPLKSESNGAAAAPAAPFNPAAMFAQAQKAPSPASSNGSAGGPKMGNPVAAFLQQQAQKPKAAAARPPFNPAAAFAQRFQGSSQKPPMPLANSSSKSGGEDQDDEDTENGDKNGAEPSLKKVKPRLSIDAARASAARRMRNSGNGAALAGRGSLDVFLNEIGDVGRLSDLKMDEFQTLDELWRVSDDMNRLSL